jgi:translation initiation factor 2B subunit (eIF-2B alpha/beta/delta family)
VDVLNYYFEEIPFDYVSKLICEEGVFEMHEFIKWYLKD